jgi:hypothetical protein
MSSIFGEIDPKFSAWLGASPLSGLVPYTGATDAVNLGSEKFSAGRITTDNSYLSTVIIISDVYGNGPSCIGTYVRQSDTYDSVRYYKCVNDFGTWYYYYSATFDCWQIGRSLDGERLSAGWYNAETGVVNHAGDYADYSDTGLPNIYIDWWAFEVGPLKVGPDGAGGAEVRIESSIRFAGSSSGKYFYFDGPSHLPVWRLGGDLSGKFTIDWWNGSAWITKATFA